MAGIAKDQRQQFLVAAGDLQDWHIRVAGVFNAPAVPGKVGFGPTDGQRDRLKGFEGGRVDRYHLFNQPRNIGSDLRGILRRYLKEGDLVRAHLWSGMSVRSVKQDSLSRNAPPGLELR